MTLDDKIGTTGERSLHAALKRWYARPGDEFEQEVDGFLIDIVRGPLLIEIQTRNFSALKGKMSRLTAAHPVRLVHPVAQERWILRLASDGMGLIDRRKSPHRGKLIEVFDELVSLPELVAHPNFSLHVLFIQEEQLRRDDGRGTRRRRHYSVFDRRLLDVSYGLLFESPADFRRFVPRSLAEPFTTRELAGEGRIPVARARQIAYCLRAMGTITQVGKRGNAILYVASGQEAPAVRPPEDPGII